MKKMNRRIVKPFLPPFFHSNLIIALKISFTLVYDKTQTKNGLGSKTKRKII
jgi:hypothetical protein